MTSLAPLSFALPVFLAHFGLAALILLVGLALYMAATPYHELALVRQGNRAAGITLAGALLGLALPVAEVLRTSAGLWDILIWGIVAITLQLLAFGLVSLVLRGIRVHIEEDRQGVAWVVAAAQLGVGLLNAAALGL